MLWRFGCAVAIRLCLSFRTRCPIVSVTHSDLAPIVSVTPSSVPHSVCVAHSITIVLYLCYSLRSTHIAVGGVYGEDKMRSLGSSPLHMYAPQNAVPCRQSYLGMAGVRPDNDKGGPGKHGSESTESEVGRRRNGVDSAMVNPGVFATHLKDFGYS